MKFVITRTRNKQFRVNIVADNGEKLFTSETYTRKAKAMKAVGLAIDIGRDGVYEIEDKTNGSKA